MRTDLAFYPYAIVDTDLAFVYKDRTTLPVSIKHQGIIALLGK